MVVIPEHSEAWQIYHEQDPIRDEYNPSSLKALQLRQVSTPKPAKGEVLVRMRAAALNFRDLLVIANSPHYPQGTTPGLVPCSDGAGEVVERGEGSDWKVGDKVILTSNQGWLDGKQENWTMDTALGGGEKMGTLTQYRIVRDAWLVTMPNKLSFEEAASLPTAGGTAVHALFHSGVTDKGSMDLSGRIVLVQGTGGVSMFALQLAVAAGSKVVATTSSTEKLELVKKLGAAHVIDYHSTPDWADEVLKVTDDKGVDLVVEVGGAGTIEQSLKATRMGGTIVIVGNLTASKQMDLMPAILFGAKTLKGHLGSSRAMQDELVKAIGKYDISPLIGKVFEWQDAPSAFEHMMTRGAVGKIVIRI